MCRKKCQVNVGQSNDEDNGMRDHVDLLKDMATEIFILDKILKLMNMTNNCNELITIKSKLHRNPRFFNR